jgi:hypothetical protein
MPKDTLMTPSNPKIILHLSLHLNFTKTFLLVNRLPSSNTNLQDRSPSRFENFITEVLALKMNLIIFSPTIKQDKAPQNV